jgi:hypothetical protein
MFKKILDKIMDILIKQYKLDKILNYVEKPNELDKEVESIKKELKKLKELAHPVADFVCTKCGTKAKRVKNKLNKLKEKF